MAKGLPVEQAVKMMGAFRVYCETGHLEETARRTGDAITTVRRWAKEFDWQARLNSASEEVMEELGITPHAIVKRLLLGGQTLLDEMVTRIDEVEMGTIKDTATAFNNVASTMQLLIGNPTSREESVSTKRTISGAELTELYKVMHGAASQPAIEVHVEEDDEAPTANVDIPSEGEGATAS